MHAASHLSKVAVIKTSEHRAGCLRRGDEVVIVSARPSKGAGTHRGACAKPCSGYDQGGGWPRWRSLDVAVIRARLEADAPRVRYLTHGVVVAQILPLRPPSRRAREPLLQPSSRLGHVLKLRF